LKKQSGFFLEIRCNYIFYSLLKITEWGPDERVEIDSIIVNLKVFIPLEDRKRRVCLWS